MMISGNQGRAPELGVTVVTASYRAPDVTLRCLRTLAAQTLDAERFEVILVVNGPQARDLEPYEAFAAANPTLQLRIIGSPRPGACHSLNLGIQAARMPWTTFVDDDDEVSAGFLEGLLAVAGPKLVPLAFISDVYPDGTVDEDNRINTAVRPLAGLVVPPEDCPTALSFNAAKLLPTDWASRILYDRDLKSGQDIAFFEKMYAIYDFDLAVVVDRADVTYFRSMSDQSQSRREPDFDFAVRERLAVIQILEEQIQRSRDHKVPMIRSAIRSQASFMRRFIDTHPDRRTEVNAYIRGQHSRSFPWEVLNRGAAKKLVVSVCFPPHADASSVTVAKRVAEARKVVDVVSNDMGTTRSVDPTLSRIADEWVDSHLQVKAPVSFGSWTAARKFCELGRAALHRRLGDSWPYDEVYSRSMWPASHLLAGQLKIEHPEVQWSAEFSDPISRSVDGRHRDGPLEYDEFATGLLDAARRTTRLELSGPRSLFELVELVPYALADTIVFTNANQREYMLSYCQNEQLAAVVRAKSVIAPHPIPSPELYRVERALVPREGAAVHVAYFGNFYSNRSLDDVIDAVTSLPLRIRRFLSIDIYTPPSEDLERRIMSAPVSDVVRIFEPVDYLKFLNLAAAYDVLLVSDAATSGSHSCNPYLPSKWSDYRGSGTPIWMISETGSTMDALRAEFASRLGDVRSIRRVLEEIVETGAARAVKAGQSAPEINDRLAGRTRVG